MSTPPEPHPSTADRMRVRLARARLRDLRELDLSNPQPADLMLAVNRLAGALEDMIGLATQDWPGNRS